MECRILCVLAEQQSVDSHPRAPRALGLGWSLTSIPCLYSGDGAGSYLTGLA